MSEYTTELKMMDAITSETPNKVASEIANLLKDFATKKGLQLKISSKSYDANRLKFDLELSRIVYDEDDNELDKFGADFVNTFKVYGMRLKDLNRVFEINKEKVKLIGVDREAELYPVVIERMDGRRSRISAKDAKRCIKFAEEEERVMRRRVTFGRETEELPIDGCGNGW